MGGEDTLWLVLRTLLALPVVLGAAWFTIRFVLGRKSFLPGVRRMRVVESLPLSARGALVLVELGGRYYFLACQEGAVTLIKEMEELPDPVTDPRPAPAWAGPGWSGWPARLSRPAALWPRADVNHFLKAWRKKDGPR